MDAIEHKLSKLLEHLSLKGIQWQMLDEQFVDFRGIGNAS